MQGHNADVVKTCHLAGRFCHWRLSRRHIGGIYLSPSPSCRHASAHYAAAQINATVSALSRGSPDTALAKPILGAEPAWLPFCVSCADEGVAAAGPRTEGARLGASGIWPSVGKDSASPVKPHAAAGGGAMGMGRGWAGAAAAATSSRRCESMELCTDSVAWVRAQE